MAEINHHMGRERVRNDAPAAAPHAVSPLRRPQELWALGGLLIGYFPVYVLQLTWLYDPMNIIGPLVLGGVLGWSAYHIAERDPDAVWAPLFWFRIASAAYFGFGALVPHIVNLETLQHIQSLYYFDAAMNFKVNFLYCTGIFFTLMFSYIFLGLFGGRFQGARNRKRSQVDRTLQIAIVFLTVGAILRYGMVVPYTFGLTDSVLPGVIGTLSRMYYVGIYLLIVYAMDRNKKILLPASVLVAIDIVVSVSSFAKAELLLILIFSFLGFISRGVTKKKVLAGALCVLFAYFWFQPLVGYGRAELALRYGEIRGAGLYERIDIVKNYFAGAASGNTPTRQGGLSRLSYMNVDSYVVSRYDAGMPGYTLGDAAAVLVPRVFWPGKPIITQLGADLNFLVFRQVGSSLGVGHFAEAYWNFGWLGIVPFMFVLALILTIFSLVSMGIVARKDWLFFPVVFIGVYMGIRVDGFFVPDILGPAWMALVLGAGLSIARLFLLSPAGLRSRRFVNRT